MRGCLAVVKEYLFGWLLVQEMKGTVRVPNLRLNKMAFLFFSSRELYYFMLHRITILGSTVAFIALASTFTLIYVSD